MKIQINLKANSVLELIGQLHFLAARIDEDPQLLSSGGSWDYATMVITPVEPPEYFIV